MSSSSSSPPSSPRGPASRDARKVAHTCRYGRPAPGPACPREPPRAPACPRAQCRARRVSRPWRGEILQYPWSRGGQEETPPPTRPSPPTARAGARPPELKPGAPPALGRPDRAGAEEEEEEVEEERRRSGGGGALGEGHPRGELTPGRGRRPCLSRLERKPRLVKKGGKGGRERGPSVGASDS